MKAWPLLAGRVGLITEQGEPIKIVYPGRRNDDRGADFRDAVIASRRGLSKGDVEIHVKTSGWQAHHHHRDPAYNRVILHVVMTDDVKSATKVLAGKAVPVLALDRLMVNGKFEHLPQADISCLATRLSQSSLVEFLDDAGKKRFLAKAAAFAVSLAEEEASQTLYQGIMYALGYAKNKLPFLELARRLPLKTLEAIAKDDLPEDECLARQQALLLGTAGLLPSQRGCREGSPDEWADRLEGLWGSLPQPEVMPADIWHRFKVRPNNFPVRRIAAMSYLVQRYREQGLLPGLINAVRQAPISSGYRDLEKGLLVSGSGSYWANHFDFGTRGRARESTLLGSRRAADIVVNVVLPFTYAWSQEAGLRDKALKLYCSYPRLVVNAVEKHMRSQFKLDSRLVSTARRQQGLIHIYHTLCTEGGCHSCPLSQPQAGNNIQG